MAVWWYLIGRPGEGQTSVQAHMNTSDIKQPLPASNPKLKKTFRRNSCTKTTDAKRAGCTKYAPRSSCSWRHSFIVYDSRDFHDRSESTWAYCSQCNQIGMTVTKVLFSWERRWFAPGMIWSCMNEFITVHSAMSNSVVDITSRTVALRKF